jgi:hypothetical protein
MGMAEPDGRHKMPTRERWGQGLFSVGGIAMLVGAVDPMEGSLAILPGSGLMALGAFLAHAERLVMLYRLAVFGLITIGVGSLWGMTMFGGIGNSSGHSPWWGLLLVPYVVGWPKGILGRDSPRWLTWGGIVIGAWFVAMPFMMLARSVQQRPPSLVPVMGIGLLGAVTIAGAVFRLRQGRQRSSG